MATRLIFLKTPTALSKITFSHALSLNVSLLPSPSHPIAGTSSGTLSSSRLACDLCASEIAQTRGALGVEQLSGELGVSRLVVPPPSSSTWIGGTSPMMP